LLLMRGYTPSRRMSTEGIDGSMADAVQNCDPMAECCHLVVSCPLRHGGERIVN
jgi:hypothetical protein